MLVSQSRIHVVCCALIVLLGFGSNSATAAGLLVADGGLGGVLEIQEQAVEVTINNGIAVTEVDQRFLNTENRTVEALYTFPVPNGASVANFSMWINGKEMIGEVVEKERAREIYESYKRVNRDPGLLEQVDFKTFEMRIFPIPAGAEQRVKITYYQQLDVDDDRVTYVYPLDTNVRREIDQATTGRFALTMRVLSEIPIEEMSSPSHADDFVVVAHSPKFQEASYETDGGDLSRDFVVSYRTTRGETGFDLITSKPEGEDGYFMLTLTAGEELEAQDEPMDYVFVLDISGSMADEGKLRLSRQAIEAFISALEPHDRFQVMTFNVQPTTLFDFLVNANDEAMKSAMDFLNSQQARGGTVLGPAMTTAYKYGDPDRHLNVVILSDGMTEQNERAQLLQLIRQRPSNTTVFAIGVGNDVNRPLLSQLADDAGGLAAFISRGDDFRRQALAFRRKLIRPAATGVQLDFDGVEVYDIVPEKLPNLYHGAPVRVFGRFKNSENFKVKLLADVRGREFTQSAQLVADKRDNPEIERMWASNRITQLLRDADRAGSRDRVIPEIVDLGETYSIVTQYTSFIVLENDEEYRRWKIDRRNAQRISRDRAVREPLRDRMEKLREQSLAQLGPRPEKKETASSKKSFSSSGPTPEPSTLLMLLLGIGQLLFHRRRRSRR